MVSAHNVRLAVVCLECRLEGPVFDAPDRSLFATTRRSATDRVVGCGSRFPADCPHRTDFHCLRIGHLCLVRRRVPSDTRMFQHIARFCNRHSDVCLTVIVTAAVYWGLSSKLRSEELTYPLDLPAPGRRQSVYSVLRLRTLLCF